MSIAYPYIWGISDNHLGTLEERCVGSEERMEPKLKKKKKKNLTSRSDRVMQTYANDSAHRVLPTNKTIDCPLF